jgi:hypothetical protein
MKKSELQQIIKEEINKTLKEENDLYSQASDKARKLMIQLEDLALNGEIGNQDIDELRGRLRSARAKMFSNRKSPEDRQAAAQKAATTKKLESILNVEKNKIDKQLGYEDDASASFALSLGMYKDKSIQSKYNKALTKSFLNTAISQGFDAKTATDYVKSMVYMAY